jgi:hypothetical protein
MKIEELLGLSTSDKNEQFKNTELSVRGLGMQFRIEGLGFRL